MPNPLDLARCRALAEELEHWSRVWIQTVYGSRSLEAATALRAACAEVERLRGPWPHGVRCGRCGREITGEVKTVLPSADIPDEFGEIPVRVITCAECWTNGGEV